MTCLAGLRRNLVPHLTTALLLGAALATTGCLQTDFPQEATGNAEASLEQKVLDRAEHYRDFERVTTSAYGSDLGDFDIDVFVSGAAADDYERIAPDGAAPGVTLPVGTIIVREVHDANGKVEKLTMMAKAPEGYSPEMGDWWWAVTDPKGVPLEKDGEVMKGKMPECWSCHLERGEGNDYLFGVPTSVK